MTAVEEIRQLYRLDEKDIEDIGSIIIEDFTAGVNPVAQPIIVITGGQPGSGKSELITHAQALLGHNAVICNADEYRDYHPMSEQIKKNHEASYPEITAEYSKPWNDRLKGFCEENQLNYILETTFSSGGEMNNTIRKLKKKGYLVYIMILAVNKRLSFLGTRLRYEGMKATHSYGRLVDQEIHDAKYEDIVPTLKAVQKASLYDKIMIYGRAGRQNVKGKHNGLVRISENSAHPVKDYTKEREKEWSDNDNRFFNDDILYLIRLMVDREANYADLKFVLDAFQVGLGDE